MSEAKRISALPCFFVLQGVIASFAGADSDDILDIINKNFAPKETSNLYYIAKTPKEAIEYIKNYDFKKIDYLNKKLMLK